jgi:hypothetical protein
MKKAIFDRDSILNKAEVIDKKPFSSKDAKNLRLNKELLFLIKKLEKIILYN